MKLRSRYFKIVGIIGVLALAGGIAYYSLVPSESIVDFSYNRDAKEVLKIFYDDWDWLFPGPQSDYSPEYIIEHRTPGDAAYYKKYAGKLQIKVLRDGGRVAGFTTFYKKNFFQGWIQFVAVSKDFRRKGYGRKLTEYAMRQLFSMGCRKVSLLTRTFNTRARSLYKKIGFTLDLEDEDQFAYYSITREQFKRTQSKKYKHNVSASRVESGVA